MLIKRLVGEEIYEKYWTHRFESTTPPATPFPLTLPYIFRSWTSCWEPTTDIYKWDSCLWFLRQVSLSLLTKAIFQYEDVDPARQCRCRKMKFAHSAIKAERFSFRNRYCSNLKLLLRFAVRRVHSFIIFDWYDFEVAFSRTLRSILEEVLDTTGRVFFPISNLEHFHYWVAFLRLFL